MKRIALKLIGCFTLLPISAGTQALRAQTSASSSHRTPTKSDSRFAQKREFPDDHQMTAAWDSWHRQVTVEGWHRFLKLIENKYDKKMPYVVNVFYDVNRDCSISSVRTSSNGTHPELDAMAVEAIVGMGGSNFLEFPKGTTQQIIKRRACFVLPDPSLRKS